MISVKEGVASGITKNVGVDVTNPILRTADETNFKTIDAYSISSLMNAIIDRTDRPEAANICRQYGSFAEKQFDFHNRLATNVERFVTIAA